MMHLRAAAGEATRNIRTGTARAGAVASLVVLASLALLFVDLFAIAAIQSRAETVRAHAGDVRVLVTKNSIEPSACASLAGLAGIESAGAVRELDPVRPLALDDVAVPAFIAGPGVAHMLQFPSAEPGGVYISTGLATRWHVRSGSRLETSLGTVAIAGVFPYREDDGRDPRFADAFVVIGDDHLPAAECWYRTQPATTSLDGLARGAAAALTSPGSAAQIATLNPTVGQQGDFASEYRTRPTALAVPGVVLVFALTSGAALLRRRLELASNLHAGARYRDLAGVLVIETVLWTAPAGIALFFLTRLASRLILVEQIPGSDASLAGMVAAAVAAALCGALIPLLLTRESRLFGLFKARV